MNSINKKRLLIILITLLVIINVSALSTIYYNSKIKVKKIDKINIQKEEIRRSGMYDYFRNELKLSDEQFNAFKNINREYAVKTRNKSDELNNYRHLLIDEIANKDPNLKNIDSISRQIGNLHYELKLLTSDHFLGLKEICNEEQQEVLKKLFIRMISVQDKEPRRNSHRRENQEKHYRRRDNR
jgi:hypothetical protein